MLASVGAGDQFTYKKSRRGNADIDRATLERSSVTQGNSYNVLEFSPYGYDERQFCSPGFDLPVGCFMRTPNGQFPEYHTSADNLDFVQPSLLAESFEVGVRILRLLENNGTYMNQNPKCEPQLGKRGLYRAIGGVESRVDELAMLWVLNLSDGKHSLLDIAERSGSALRHNQTGGRRVAGPRSAKANRSLAKVAQTSAFSGGIHEHDLF